MRTLLLLSILMLAGCGALPVKSTSVEPVVTDLTNDLVCLAKAQAGDCATPCPVPVAAACAYLDRLTATLSDNANVLEACAAMDAVQKFVPMLATIQAGLCAQHGKIVGATVPPATLQVVPLVPATGLGGAKP